MKRKCLAFRAFILAPVALAALAALGVGVPGAFSTGSAPANGSMSCSVKASCTGSEVAVFRVSSTANAHAGTAGGSSYGNVVCCGGLTALGTNCTGTYETVLTLSAPDNAHVASEGGYPTAACLSVGAGTVGCTYGDTCGAGYACLATISGSTNAHVADCDGSNDYATKVCCLATSGGPPVGGVAELPGVSGSSGPPYAALAGGLAAAVVAVAAGGWYARRRWLR